MRTGRAQKHSASGRRRDVRSRHGITGERIRHVERVFDPTCEHAARDMQRISTCKNVCPRRYILYNMLFIFVYTYAYKYMCIHLNHALAEKEER